ncbi:MAG: hypothetical protein HDR48_03540 [Bacteroides sp.]|nr:hypothetical protein [Bacteroides sp.]
MATIDILKKSYEQIKLYPLFFFNAVEEWDYSTRQTVHYWVPEAVYVSEDRSNRIFKESIESKTKDILFAFGKPSPEQVVGNTDYIRLDLESFDANNIEHVKAVLTIFLTKAYNTSDRFSAREFLWMLNSYCIEIPILSAALESFDQHTIQPFFWNALKHYSMCLSVPKQRLIQQFLSSKGVSSNIYLPQSLNEALKYCYPTIDFSNENRSIFQLIYIAVRSAKYKDIEIDQNSESINNPDNFFLQIRKWLTDSEYQFSDFDTLSNLFRLFSPDVQVLLVKRYFHAVRTGYVQFNQELLKSFQENKFENWGTYYHCAHEASKPIRLAVQLLCDNILTFLNSGNTVLQTINGTLDMAYAQCDTNSPEVDFGLKHIVPVCNGGAVPNNAKFAGFICYKIVLSLNEKEFTSEAILKNFRKYLNLFGRQLTEPVCHNEETTLQQCQASLADVHACDNCISSGIKRLDKFELRLGDDSDNYKRTILRFFTNTAFTSGSIVLVAPTQSMIAPDEVRRRIVSWLNENLQLIPGITTRLKSGTKRQLKSGWRSKNDLDSCYNSIVRDYLLPSWCTIEPRRNAYIGRGVLNKETGIDEEFNRRNRIRSSNDVKIQEKENAIILPRIVAALNERLDVQPDNNGVYHIPYDVELLRKLKTDFYTLKEEENSTIFNERNTGFMTTTKSKYDRYCAPKYDNDINFVTHLPFMWCRGKECFKTSLGDQTLASCKTWSQYTILHLLEILGFPQITETSGGNEASELLRSFIGMVNKASALFKRVRCRECNHILFPIGGSNFNRYNNFECRVPTCGERGKRIYLSQCHHCKTGLIDSRDSAQCPNGWHICPKCLSCCDDALYERMASKYVLRKLTIPPRISEKLGHGHNDKDDYFCPKCGGEIATVRDEHTDRIAKVCQVCKTIYEEL